MIRITRIIPSYLRARAAVRVRRCACGGACCTRVRMIPQRGRRRGCAVQRDPDLRRGAAATRCSVTRRCDAVRCAATRRAALRRVVLRCNLLRCAATCHDALQLLCARHGSVLHCAATRCAVMQRVALLSTIARCTLERGRPGRLTCRTQQCAKVENVLRTHAHARTHVRTHTHAHTHARTHPNTRTRTQTRTRTHARARTCAGSRAVPCGCLSAVALPVTAVM